MADVVLAHKTSHAKQKPESSAAHTSKKFAVPKIIPGDEAISRPVQVLHDL